MKSFVKQHFKALLWFFFYLFIEYSFVFSSLYVESIDKGISMDKLPLTDQYNCMYIASLFMFLIYAGFIIMRQHKTKSVFKKPDKAIFPFVIALSIASYFVISLLLTFVTSFIPDTITNTYTVDQSFDIGSASNFMSISVAICSPIMEEVVFRYGLFNLLSKSLTSSDKWNRVLPYYAIVMQAVVFGLAHGNLLQGIYAFILGMLLGFMYYKTGNLLYTIIFHMIFNFIPVILTAFAYSYMPLIILFIALIFGIIFIINIKRPSNQVT